MGDQTEAALVAVEVRAVSEPLRQATMLVCRYGETSAPGHGPERFGPGAFTQSVTERGRKVPFTTKHSRGGSGELPRGSVVARPMHWHPSEAELLADLQFFDTPEGWEAFVAAQDGELTGASVGFRAVEERLVSGVRELVRAALHHVMLVDRRKDTPVYTAPGLVEVRAGQPDPEEVKALLAVTYDPALAERGQDTAARLARVAGEVAEWPV
jgi:HK97 family phage prohead protease